MAKKKKKQVDITNPFEEQLQQEVQETFTVDPNAKPPKLGQTFPGSIIAGIKTIANLPAIAMQNLLGGPKPYKFTNKNVMNGMQALSAPYRRLIAEPFVTKVAVAQDAFRNPGKYWLNPDALFETYQKAYDAAQGNRDGLEWYRDPKNPVTFGQALDVLTQAPWRKDLPSLLDTEAVYKYYVNDPDGEGPLEAPGRTRSGAMDFMAILLFDPINYIPMGGATKVAKVATTAKGAVKAGTETLDLTAKGLKELTPENFRTISDAAYASGREDIGDFLLLLDETGSSGRDKLVNSFVFFGSPEFSQTASILKSSFYDYDILAKNLPGQDIPEVPSFSGLTDVKYFADNGDAFAVTDNTILQWVHPYTNSKGQSVEGYWRESALFPRSILNQSQTAMADEAIDLTAGISKTIDDAEKKIEFDYTTPEFPATIDTGYMFQYSLAGARLDLDLPSSLGPDLRVPTNSLELPIYDGTRFNRSGLRSKDVNYASVFIDGKRIVLASRFKDGKQEIFKLESVRKTYKPKELESEDVLARADELDESIDPAQIANLQKKTDKIVKKVLALKGSINDTTDVKSLFNSALTKSELKIYKDTVNDRFLAGLITQDELNIINRYGIAFDDSPNLRMYQNINKWPVRPVEPTVVQVNNKSFTVEGKPTVQEKNTTSPKDEYSIETIQGIDDEIADEFFKLLSGDANDIPMGIFDEFDEAGGISAFADDMKSLTDTGTVTPSLTRATTVRSRQRELVWVPQSQLDLRSIEGYETIFYSPIDGSAIATVVPKNFRFIKPANSMFDGNVNLPELIYSPAGYANQVYSFNIAGEVVPMAEAKASFARLKETLVRKQLELREAQDKVVQTAIKTVERGDAGLESQFTRIEEAMDTLLPQIKTNAGEIARLKKLRSKNQSELSGSVGLSGMTDQEITLLRLSDQYDRLTARRESLAIAINVESQVPKTPQEIGFYFKITAGPEISLVRRTLDWDSFNDGSIRNLLTPPVDEVIGIWKLTWPELNVLNFTSVKNGGYSTDWDIFKSLNAGDESVYTVNAAEVKNWATKKSFRVRDYRTTINKLRKDSGRNPIPYDPDIDNSMNLNELLKEQARIEWTNQNKARVWAQQVLGNPNASPKAKANAQKVLDQTTTTIKELEEQIARDTDLITKVLSEGYSGPEITPKLWQAIYGQVQKPEMWLQRFLNTLNTFKKTNVSLMDDAVSKLDIIDSPYPVATVDGWGELPMSTPDSAIPEEVLEQVQTPGIATDAPQSIPVASFDPALPVVIHSGGAKGSDSVFAEIADQLNIETKAHSFKGHKLANAGKIKNETRVEHSAEELAEADELLEKVNTNYLERKIPSDLFVKNLLRRNYFQVKNSDAVIAISSFDKNFTVKGGTGWAVGMGVELGKPVYVFNLDNNRWYKIVDEFEGITINGLPPKFNNFAGVGTREITEKGKQAIREYLEQYRGNKTLNIAQVAEPQSTTVAPKVFVFGSNLAGRHGKGAALEAKERYGAVYGQGVGLQGQSYAIPTKGNKLEKLTPEQIKPYIDEFVTFVKENPNIEFGLTDIGLGLADNKPEVIASLFNEVPSNITFITKNSRLKAALVEQGKVKNDNI